MKKRIVIAGFGDTGLLAAVHLSKRYEIIGISPKPCLVSGQELGTRLANPEQWQKNYLMEFHRYKSLAGVKTIHGSVTTIDSEAQTVTVKTIDNQVQVENYDVLIIASGVTNGFWRNNQLEQWSDIQLQLKEQAQRFENANSIAIVGAGPTGVSAASNLKEQYPCSEVHLFFSQEQPLPGYHPKTRTRIEQQLKKQSIHLHPAHRALISSESASSESPSAIRWQSGQEDFKTDQVLWATGQLRPNNAFIPKNMLTDNGFVNCDSYLRVAGFENIFTVGDIAATDPNRSSARNAGFLILAKNVEAYLKGKPSSMKAFKATTYRWGSILGVQNNGMRIFTPKGSNVLVSRWWVEKLLFPFFVRKLIYRGVISTH